MKLPVFIAIALILGAVAAFMAARFVAGNKDGDHASEVKVVIVDQPIAAGTAITADQIKAVDWHGSVVPSGALARTSDVAGRIAREPMIPGEPVLPGKLAPINATGGLSSMITPGKRAITVKVNEEIAVAGFAMPGSYVDVLVRGRDGNSEPFSITVLSRVKVLAVAQETAPEQDKKPKLVSAVTLELTPFEAEKLDLARKIGDISFDLRNEFDAAVINSSGARLSDIFSSQSTPATTPLPAAQAKTGHRNVSPSSRHSIGLDEIRGLSRQSMASP